MDAILRPATGAGTWKPILRPPSGRGRGASRHAAWAARLAARYRVGILDRGRPAAILRLGRTPGPPGSGAVTLTTRTIHGSGHLALAITLRLAAPPARTAVAATARPASRGASPDERRWLASPVGPVMPGTSSRLATAAHELVARVTRRVAPAARGAAGRAVPIEARYGRRAGPTTAAEVWASAPPPVPRVLVTPQAAPAMAPMPAAKDPWQGDQAPARAPAMDVERLADEVIRSIDRRVIAARERFGRG